MQENEPKSIKEMMKEARKEFLVYLFPNNMVKIIEKNKINDKDIFKKIFG